MVEFGMKMVQIGIKWYEHGTTHLSSLVGEAGESELEDALAVVGGDGRGHRRHHG